MLQLRLDRKSSTIRVAFTFLLSHQTASTAATDAGAIVAAAATVVKPCPCPHDQHVHAAQDMCRHGLGRESVPGELQKHVHSRSVKGKVDFLFVDDDDAVLWVKARVGPGRRPV